MRWMTKRSPLAVVVVLATLLLPPFLAARGGQEEALPNPADIAEMEWKDIVAGAADTEVRFYMWGGSDTVNSWIDGFVASRMAEIYDISLTRVPMDAVVFINKLLTEKQARQNRGTIDLVWINGENFRNARDGDLLFGPFTEVLPHYRDYVDPASAEFDAGYPVNGYEAPWGKAQFNLDVDTARVSDPPESFSELAAWVRRNPGRFTYPQPPDFTGSAFLRQAFYAVTGGHEQYLEGWDEELFNTRAPLLWEYLNEIAPFLWQEGRSYPRDLAALAALFERAEVDFTMSFTQTNAATRIQNGRYPETVRSLVFSDGSLFNTHFVAVPFNAPNAYGALVTANFLLSPEAQYSKNRLENWGDFTVLAMDRLPAEYRQRFSSLDLGSATVPLDELERYAVPEIPSDYWEALERGWDRNVRQR